MKQFFFNAIDTISASRSYGYYMQLRYRLIDRWKWKCSAIDFEKKFQATGIAGYYTMPENLTPRQVAFETLAIFTIGQHGLRKALFNHMSMPELIAIFQNACKGELKTEKTVEQLNQKLDVLLELNPELNELQLDRDDPRKILHVIWGATSGYNVNDIQYFMDTFDDTEKLELDSEESKRIEESYGAEIRWRPSPETRQKIIAHLKANPPSKKQDSFEHLEFPAR